MTTRNGIAVLRARVEKELNDIREVVKRVEEKLTAVSQATPDDFTVGGFASYLHSFYIEWDELKPKVERVRSTFDQVEVALRNFFAFLNTAGEQIE